MDDPTLLTVYVRGGENSSNLNTQTRALYDTLASLQHTTVRPIIARVSSPRCFHGQESTARSSITVTNKYVKPRKMIFLQGVTIIALQLRRVGALIVLKCAYNSIDQYIHVCIGPIYSLEKRGKTHCFA